jgi:hypothetical protein
MCRVAAIQEPTHPRPIDNPKMRAAAPNLKPLSWNGLPYSPMSRWIGFARSAVATATTSTAPTPPPSPYQTPL